MASEIPQPKPAVVPVAVAKPVPAPVAKLVVAAVKPVVAPVAKPVAPVVAVAAKPVVAPAKTVTFELPAAVYSPQLLESVIYDITIYLDWYRQNKVRKRVGTATSEEPNHSDETVVVIETWLSGKPPTVESIEGLLTHLKQLKLPKVHIMLAALPNRAQRETLVNWFRSNGGHQLLVSFVADRNLGGGLVVRTPNHVFDYSWKQQLVGGRDKLAEILRRV